MGFTCAACHTGLVEVGGRRLLIDGGQTQADFTALVASLVLAMRAILDEPKLGRLADRVLGADADPAAKAALRQRLEVETAALVARQDCNNGKVVYGPGQRVAQR